MSNDGAQVIGPQNLRHRALLHHNLFLSHRDAHLVLAYLGLGCAALRDRHPLYGDLLAAGGDLYLLAVGPHALADADRAGLALAGSGSKLFLGPLNPELVLVCEGVALALVDALVGRRVLAELSGLGVA